MSSHYDKILERLDQLIERGQSFEYQTFPTNPDTKWVRDVPQFKQWVTSCKSFLHTNVGRDSVYFSDFERLTKEQLFRAVENGLSVLRALREDLAGGYLRRVETLVSADVFSDFLGMAGHLLEHGYKDPAAVLAGAVLEDGLRRIADSQGMTVKGDDNIKSLNDKLVQGQVYNRLSYKKVLFWNDVRNHAAHGNFDEYTGDDVKEMLKGVSSFLEQHL